MSSGFSIAIIVVAGRARQMRRSDRDCGLARETCHDAVTGADAYKRRSRQVSRRHCEMVSVHAGGGYMVVGGSKGGIVIRDGRRVETECVAFRLPRPTRNLKFPPPLSAARCLLSHGCCVSLSLPPHSLSQHASAARSRHQNACHVRMTVVNFSIFA